METDTASNLNAASSATVEVDVLLICALKEEYDQVLKVKDGLIYPAWEECVVADGWIVSDGSFETPSGIRLNIRTTWSSHMGREQAQAVASKLILLRPVHCIAMSGICAGWRGKVNLGDVIFADRLWSYDAGKRTKENGVYVVKKDTLPYILEKTWVQRMQNFVVPSNAPWLETRPAVPLESQENWVLLRMLHGENPTT